jgi:hypothetical protein
LTIIRTIANGRITDWKLLFTAEIKSTRNLDALGAGKEWHSKLTSFRFSQDHVSNQGGADFEYIYLDLQSA